MPSYEKKEPALEDTDPMPFGKFKEKGLVMQDVPSKYLLWLWDSYCNNELVDNYIYNNLDALLEENRDYIPARKREALQPKPRQATPAKNKPTVKDSNVDDTKEYKGEGELPSFFD